jgi:hypothetical protein
VTRHHDVLRAAMTLDDQLDDIKRAQIWAQLEDRLTERVPARRRWPLAVAAVAIAAAALAIVWLRPGHPHAHLLSAPPDTTLATSLGPHARAELVGPASLELLGAPGDATSVRLHSGTLLAEFTGGPGRSLRIETREAVVEIVGTLFTVEARDGATCVSVAHGKVRVTTKAATLAVAGGESWCSSTPAVTPIEPAAHDALTRFEAVIVARSDAPAERPAPAPPPMAAAPAPSPGDVLPSFNRGKSAQVKDGKTSPASAVPVAPSVPPATTAAIESSEPPPPTMAASEPAAVAADPPPAEPTKPPEPVVAAPVVEAPTAESLYEAAEAALARRDAPGADRILARLVTDFPSAPLVDQALFERARIAYDRHAWREAQQDLDQLAAIANTPLAEPGAYLACRIVLEAHDGSAAHCLTEYRKAYPRSPHDLDVLGVLTDLAYRDGGCSRARPHIDELVRAYQRTTLTRAWLDRCPEGP